MPPVRRRLSALQIRTMRAAQGLPISVDSEKEDKTDSHYERPKLVLIVLIMFVSLFILTEHIKDFVNFRTLQKSTNTAPGKPTISKNFLYSVTFNLCILFATAIGFGRPYAPPIVYFSGVLLIVTLLKRSPEYVEFGEKILTDCTILVFLGEYGYVGYNHLINKNKKDLVFVLCLSGVGFSIFLYLYFYILGDSVGDF